MNQSVHIRVQCTIVTVALLLSNATYAQDAPPQPAATPQLLDRVTISGEQPGPGMWKVSKGENVLWILGTYNPVPQKMQWRSAAVETVIAQSQAVLAVPEAKVTLKQIGFFRALTLWPSAVALKNNPDDASLIDIVPRDLYARWTVVRDKYVDGYNTEANDIDKWRPIFAALELYRAAIKQVGLTQQSPVWPRVTELAKKHKVKITELAYSPEIGDARAAVKQLRNSRLADIDCFAKTIERIETDLVAMRARANAWAVGDVDALRALPQSDQRAACEAAIRDTSAIKTLGVQDVPLQLENMWLAAAESALGNNKSTLAVLPISQLVTATGYLAKLKARGYTVQEPTE